jgi:thioredoxin reductase (NADPH)
VLKNDFVFALTGYHPDYDFLRAVGIQLSAPEMRPVCDPNTFESNVAGIYVAGVVVSGSRTSEIFIENGRFHGRKIAEDLAGKMKTTLSEEQIAMGEAQTIIVPTHWVNEE